MTNFEAVGAEVVRRLLVGHLESRVSRSICTVSDGTSILYSKVLQK